MAKSSLSSSSLSDHQRLPNPPRPAHCRHLVLVFGDQLDPEEAAFDGFDPATDIVWMAEVDQEATHVWSTKQRIAVFLAAMRHFREELRRRGLHVCYNELTPDSPTGEKLSQILARDLEHLKPEKVIFGRPGEWRVLEGCRRLLEKTGLPSEMREERHFFTTPLDFAQHAEGRKSLRLEYWYRELRKRTGILMEPDGQPTGGAWNFDQENRKSFGKHGPEVSGKGPTVEPDAITREVLDLVRQRFADHPGELDHFYWPVSPAAARMVLDDFIRERLPHFGTWQDAMWTGEPWLYHSWISVGLNLKLLHPREVCAAAEAAYRAGHAPLPAVEGFIRQILGWREYVRGVYWHFMPEYLQRNTLQATLPLPAFYWTGETEYACLRATIGQTLKYGYAHHIQRLMVTGLYALLLGVDPKAVHEWYLAVYVDAVEWVELPNVLGMSQYADGGVMGSKPYAATGKYIQRMSNYCESCPKKPDQKTGKDACPFTTLYWDFLLRHEEELRRNPRMSLQVRNVDRLDDATRQEIRSAAADLKGVT